MNKTFETYDLKAHERVALEKLKETKGRVEVFGMDYDGTLADGDKYKLEDAIGIIKEILEHGKTPVFSTGRAATAVKLFMPPLIEYYGQHENATATYIGGGNGTVLYKIDGKGAEKIYSHGLSVEEVKYIVSKWQEYSKENLPIESLSEKGLATFQKFYTENWEKLVPIDVLDIGRPYDGRIFTEEAKVTFVLSKNVSLHQKVVNDMQELVGDNFAVAAGDKDFCHITKRLHEDSKVVAIKAVLERLGLNERQVATFGDMPHGNDHGLLSFPYSFTNYVVIANQKPIDQPPFILSESKKDPVGSVHNAIHFLLD